MDRNYVEAHNLVERYRRGELSGSERAEFEAYFIDKPGLLETLELDHLLGLGFDRKQETAARLAPRARHPWELPLAAGFLLMFGTSLVYILQLTQENNAFEDALIEFNDSHANIDVLTLSPVRDASEEFRPVGVLRSTTDKRRVIINVQLLRPKSEAFDVAIRRHGSEEVLVQLGDVIPRGVGDLIISVPMSKLPAGDYLLEAQGPRDDPTVVQFRVIAESD